jgi:transcriptional regulator with XRE-family HTH domain
MTDKLNDRVLYTIKLYMKIKQVTKAELARQLGTSSANVTQVLRSNDLKLSTVENIFNELGYDVVLWISPKGEPYSDDQT